MHEPQMLEKAFGMHVNMKASGFVLMFDFTL